MSPAASFSERWAKDNLNRECSPSELKILELFVPVCEGDEEEAAKRARRYYTSRGPGGLAELWHRRHPDDEEILKSCQDAYIIPLKVRTVGGRKLTIVRMPAPTALDRVISAKALLSRWLMILEIRLREDPTPGEEVVFIDISDLQPSHSKKHFKGSYWKDFIWCLKNAHPSRISEVHLINTHRLKAMSFMLLFIGVNPWRRKVLHIHSNSEQINQAMGLDYFPVEGLPYEYGGKAGAMKDLNDEWTKMLLSNSKWLQTEERRFYETELKPKYKGQTRHKSAIRNLRGDTGAYDVLTRTHSCRSLHKCEDSEEGVYGAYRTLTVTDKAYFV